MNKIKYRQYLKPHFRNYGEYFHYWGYIDGGFVSPMGKNQTIGDSDQFTGLQDSQGVDIYEGDIVTWGEGVIESVFFDDGLFQTESSCLDDCMLVVGNIHQNPELLRNQTK